MIAWKKLIATSSCFTQESIDFLQRRIQSSRLPCWNAVAHLDSENDDLVEDLEEDDIAFDQTVVHNVEWTNSDDVNLDAAHLVTFLHVVDDSGGRESQNDIFYDCEQSDCVSEEEQPTQSPIRECCTIFDVNSVTALSGATPIAIITDCDVVWNSGKHSLHIPIHVGDHKIWALVDIGAAATFIQFSLAKKLGIWERHVSPREQVHYANGITEPILGVVPLDFTLQAQPVSTQAHVLHGKGPALILGFPFLEAQGLLVDCQGCQLIPKTSGNPLPCLPSMIQSGPAVVKVKRFCIDGQMPLMPLQKYQSDAGSDIFAPRSIHIRPGQRALVDTGLACAFPRTHWCLLKDKSSLAL